MDKLDSDHLRTFLAVTDTGSMTLAAGRILRSQSAASQQIKRLEETLGGAVFHRHGRGVILAPLGERLLPVAREVTTRLDQTLRQLTCDSLTGKLRVGIPDDHSADMLAQIIAEFSQSHPSVELEVRCALSAGFPKALQTGELDLAVYEVEEVQDDDDVLWSDTTQWAMSRQHDLLSSQVLPVALFDRDCWWREAALCALRDMGREFRVIVSSQSVAGIKAAVEAGVAVGLLGSGAISARIRPIGPDQGFPDMPVSHLVIGCSGGPDTPARHSMIQAIRHSFARQTDLSTVFSTV